MHLTDSYRRVFPKAIVARYEIRETRDAAAVLQNTNPQEFKHLVDVLRGFFLSADDILKPGGNEGPVAKRLNEGFRSRGWREGRYDLKIASTLHLQPYAPAGESKPHLVEKEVFNEGYKIDNVSGGVALDVEWNAKDGNLDRDIGAYRALYDASIISVGVMVTRTQADLRELGKRLGRDPFGTTTTTNLVKLEPRMTRGDGGGCPVLAVAISARCYKGK